MDEKELKFAIEQINVPKDKVFSAMDRGMKKAQEMKLYSHSTKRKVISVLLL